MAKKYSAIVCSFILPFLPGYSGGETRDFHIVRQIASFASVRFISMTSAQPAGRLSDLRPLFAEYYDPAILQARFSGWIDRSALRRSLVSRLIGLLRLKDIPVWGVDYHRDIALMAWQTRAYVLPVLKEQLQRSPSDFLFVTPQLNPVLLELDRSLLPSKTRTILLMYDVESVRIERMAQTGTALARYARRLEARRAERFERENLALFDGVVVVSDLDRAIVNERYSIEGDRVLVLENSVDTEYFSFESRESSPEIPAIVFVGHLGYRPNHDAALRLIREIMPRIRRIVPEVKTWIIGEAPSRDLLASAHPALDRIIGRVDDVRPYLRQASAVCVPLNAGSGTKYKVLEALSLGRPVVGTPIAVEGLYLEPGVHLIVEESDDAIANACIRIIQHPEVYDKMVRRGRQQVERYYSWARNLQRLEPWLDRLLKLPLWRRNA